MAEDTIPKTGIREIGDVPWGTHLCLFYNTKDDLIDFLVPYFKAGLENNESCLWVTTEPLNVDDAKGALKKEVENLDHYIELGQIEVIDASQPSVQSGVLEADRLLQDRVKKESQAENREFTGLRLAGNTFWLDNRDWHEFSEYETMVDHVIGGYRMIAVCTYSINKCNASEILDIASSHQSALIRRGDKWEILESVKRVQERTLDLTRANEKLQASFVKRQQVEETLHLQVEKLAALQATVLEITTPHDLPAQLYLIVEQAVKLLHATGGGLYLCEPEQQETRCVVSYNTLSDYTGMVLNYGEGATGIVAQTGQPLIIDDYRTWSGRAAFFEEEQPFTALLSVPMMWQNQMIGVIHVLENSEIRHFTQVDLDLLNLFAGQAAIMVEHARLHDTAKRELDECEQAEEAQRQTQDELEISVQERTAELVRANAFIAMLSQAAARLATTLDQEQVMETLGNELKSLGLACAVALLEPDRQALVVEYTSVESSAVTQSHKLIGGELHKQPIPREKWPSASLALLDQGNPWFVQDPISLLAGVLSVFPRSVIEEAAQLFGVSRETVMIFLPLVGKERVMGMLAVWGLSLQESDISALMVFAGQVAIGFENVHMYAAERQRNVELAQISEQLKKELDERKRVEEIIRRRSEYQAVLNQVIGIFATSQDLNTMLGNVQNALQANFGYDGIGITLWEAEKERQIPKVIQGMSPEVLDALISPFLRNNSHRGEVLLLRSPIFWERLRNHLRVNRIIRQTGYQTGAILPLTSGQRFLGLLVLASFTRITWPAEECNLLVTIADQLSVALEKGRLWNELQQKEELRGRLLERVIHAQEEERTRVARELHDEVSQSLTALIMRLGIVRESLFTPDDSASAILDEVEKLAQDALVEVRSTISDLRPPVLDDLGLVPALRRFGIELLERAGLILTLKTTRMPERLPQQVETVIFRIVQEALTNVRNHAHAQHVTISLTMNGKQLMMSVKDDGIGIDGFSEIARRHGDALTIDRWCLEHGHFGLVGMRERATLLGGTFKVRSVPGRGTTIRVGLLL